MIEKISNKEASSFLSDGDNKKNYPVMYKMIFHYYQLWKETKSQYIIK